MNCLAYRKRLLEDPQAVTKEMHAHRDRCHSCAAFTQRVECFETNLRPAVRVAPPEGLAERILLRQSLGEEAPVTAPSRRRLLSLAASVAIVSIGLGAVLYRWRGGQDHLTKPELARELVAHLLGAHRPGLGAVTHAVEADEINTLLARVGYVDSEALGAVDNAWPCTFRDQPTAYLVLRGKVGPVVALVLPQALAARSHRFAGPYLNGVVMPCGHGTVAVMAQTNTDLEAVAIQLHSALESV